MDFREVKVIARGGFGEISLAEPLSSKLRGHGKYIAVKKIHLTNTESTNLIEAFFQEISLMC